MSRILVPTGNGGFRSFTEAEMASAIQAGKMPKVEVFGYMEPEQKTTAAANIQLESEALTDTDIGLEFGSGPTGIDPTVLGEGKGETGIWYSDLTEGDDFPLPDEDPPETPVDRVVREAVAETAFDKTGETPEGEIQLGTGRSVALTGSTRRQMDRFAQFPADLRAKRPDLEALLDAQIASGTRDAPKDYVKPEDRVATETPAKPEKTDETRRQKRKRLRETQKAAKVAKKVPEPKPDAVDTEDKVGAPPTDASAETVTPTILKKPESESGEPKPGPNISAKYLPSPLSPNQNAVDQFFALPTSEQEKLTKAITSESEPETGTGTGTGIDNEDVKDAATKIVSALSRGREKRKQKREKRKQKREEGKTDDASKSDPDATTPNLTVPTQVGTIYKGSITDFGKGFKPTDEEENMENP